MRTIATFILRLMVDDEDPRRVSGALHTVNHPQPQTYPFRDGQALLQLLKELSSLEPGREDSALLGELPPAGDESSRPAALPLLGEEGAGG